MGLGENGTDPQFDSKIRHIFLFPVNIFSLSGLQNKQTKNKKTKKRAFGARPKTAKAYNVSRSRWSLELEFSNGMWQLTEQFTGMIHARDKELSTLTGQGISALGEGLVSVLANAKTFDESVMVTHLFTSCNFCHSYFNNFEIYHSLQN